jgi:2-polyprenyl-6-methoxyphenol hydroxylase-like FAD-dependent oxidoreductase
MTRAIVVGAGVAGPVAAMALQRVGIDACVYEAYAGDAGGIGSFLTLQANGMDALRAVDAAGAVEELGLATPRVTFYSGTGKRLGDGPLGAETALSRTLRRADLYAALRAEALRRGARIEHGKRLVTAETGPDGVRAVFDDGTEATGDLLIGCDGLRSRVRTAIDPAAPPARYVPVLNIGGEARGVHTDLRPGEYGMVFGKRAFFGWVAMGDGDVWWFANPPRQTSRRRARSRRSPPSSGGPGCWSCSRTTGRRPRSWSRRRTPSCARGRRTTSPGSRTGTATG